MEARIILPRASVFALATSGAVKKTAPKEEKKPRPVPPPLESVLAYWVLDAATVSGLSRATLYNLMKAGKLRTILVCGRRLHYARCSARSLGGKAYHGRHRPQTRRRARSKHPFQATRRRLAASVLSQTNRVALR